MRGRIGGDLKLWFEIINCLRQCFGEQYLHLLMRVVLLLLLHIELLLIAGEMESLVELNLLTQVNFMRLYFLWQSLLQFG